MLWTLNLTVAQSSICTDLTRSGSPTWHICQWEWHVAAETSSQLHRSLMLLALSWGKVSTIMSMTAKCLLWARKISFVKKQKARSAHIKFSPRNKSLWRLSVRPKYLQRPVLSYITCDMVTHGPAGQTRNPQRTSVIAKKLCRTRSSAGAASRPASISHLSHFPKRRLPAGQVPRCKCVRQSSSHSATTLPLCALQVMYAPWPVFTTLAVISVPIKTDVTK